MGLYRRPAVLIIILLLAEGTALVVTATISAFLMPVLVAGELANPRPFWSLLGLLFMLRFMWAVRMWGDVPLTLTRQGKQ